MTALVRDDAQADIVKARGATPVVIDLYDRPTVATLLANADGAIPDHYQVRRRYDVWYRHVTLAMLAHAYLAVTAATAPKVLAAASSRSRSARSAVSWHT